MTQESTAPDREPRPTAPNLRLVLLAVLAVLLLASVAAVAYLGATRPVPALGV